jgi:CcmD family protein
MRLRILIVLMMLAAAAPQALSAATLAEQPQPPKDFVPVDEVPQGEQIPAMPLLGAAYGFIWIGVFGYVWSLGRRLQRVETEIAQLEARRR